MAAYLLTIGAKNCFMIEGRVSRYAGESKQKQFLRANMRFVYDEVEVDENMVEMQMRMLAESRERVKPNDECTGAGRHSRTCAADAGSAH